MMIMFAFILAGACNIHYNTDYCIYGILYIVYNIRYIIYNIPYMNNRTLRSTDIVVR